MVNEIVIGPRGLMFSAAVILFILGLAAASWFGVFEATYWFRRLVSQSQRRALVTGASPFPREPVRIEIRQHERQCLVIESVDVDGRDVFVIARNGCDRRISWVATEIAVKAKTEGGVTVRSLTTFSDGLVDADAGERLEYRVRLESDPRIAVVEVSPAKAS